MIKAIRGIIKGIKFALEGWSFAFRNDEHFRINSILSFSGVILSLIFLSDCKALLIALINYLVFVVELINTAIERAVDTATSDYHLLAKAAKDVSASAVLSIGIFALIVDIMFLLPVILKKI
ncbi:diacylglycerol kinase [Desulfurobacterium thermolithotrophum DSM 11699]|uniref:Diacylglycerol kinase n=1 Tax=Desulfurobacterium thermolithotrophum (strain DSM 11699 / BSA) TaxID=868864 RepID=F0S395_DESTD|nr:diacylglycerol kinase family protein [Desulfurobacterium thermolithotrophum]ADY73317.1 diacylglycerol kinase [Desulfurobacterium thermolithotrophum DSM 11699]